jgi:RimJ/RimL family protein N-acetyltransferase
MAGHGKAGYGSRSLLRSHMKWAGTFRDRVYYGILREEWDAGRREPQ